MEDPESLHLQARRVPSSSSSSSTPLPPLANSKNHPSFNNGIDGYSHQHHIPLATKTRSPLSAFGGQIFKAAKRLSLTSSPSKGKEESNPPASPSFLRSGTTSPDIKKTRNAVTDESSSNQKKQGKDKKNKGKNPLVKMDLFNLRSRNSNANDASQVYLVTAPSSTQIEKTLPGSPPAPPNKETFWLKGTAGQAICTGDGYHLHQASAGVDAMRQRKEIAQFGAPSMNVRDSPNLERESGVVIAANVGAHQCSMEGKEGEYEHEHEQHRHHNKLIDNMHDTERSKHHTRMQQEVLYPAAAVATPSATPTTEFSPTQYSKQRIPQSPTSRGACPVQQSRVTSTMTEDLSQLSINSLQETLSSISDQSLVMEDAFDVYDEGSAFSASGLDKGSRSVSGISLEEKSPYGQDFVPSLFTDMPQKQRPFEHERAYALKRLEQKQLQRQSQEQEQPVEVIISPGMCSSSSGSGREQEAPAQQHQQPQHSPELSVSASVTGDESAMLDQLLTLVPGPNRPRLPSQLEWQRGFEELLQKRRDAAALTSSVGRKNSSSSWHSQESSDGKSRRHSMPDMPRGQSREIQEKQRGDIFWNPMLSSNRIMSAGVCHGSAGAESGITKRRSGYESREQQLQQPPIQRQSIAETLDVDASMALQGAAESGQQWKRTECKAEYAERCVVGPMNNIRKQDKNAVDVAFGEMLSLPPQFFVDALLDYTGKKKRSSRPLFALNAFSPAFPGSSSGVTGAPNNSKPLGVWKNFSTTNISSPPSGSFEEPSFALHQIQQQLQPTFQQHLASLLGKGEKRVLEEREQVLKKLRVLIRNGSIRWTGEFIKAGGPLALLQYCQHVQRAEETKLGQRERLLHQVLQCIKTIATLDGGVDSLVTEPIFFSLMRTLAIHEAPVLGCKSSDPTVGPRSKTSFFGGHPGSAVQGLRARSSSIPKPIHSYTRPGHHTPSHTSAALSGERIPTFSNAQASVSVLVAVLAREPELRDRILKETVADSNPPPDQTTDDDGSEMWRYSEWISYLKEIVHVCGIASLLSNEGLSQEQLYSASTGAALPASKEADRGGKLIGSSKVVSVGAGLASMGSGAPGSNFSLFSLDNIRRRRHTATAPSLETRVPGPLGGIKFEAGEDREVLAYLTAHLGLVSKLIFDMHVSGPALAFAKTLKDCHMEEIFERLHSEFIQHEDLSAQLEDLLIQLSIVPCMSKATESAPERPTSPTPPTMSPSHQKLQFQHRPLQHHVQREQKLHYHLDDVRYDSQAHLRASDTATDMLSNSRSPELLARGQQTTPSDRRTGLGHYGDTSNPRPQYGGAVARSNSQLKPNHASQDHQLSGVGTGNAAARIRQATGLRANGIYGSKEASVEGGGKIRGGSTKSPAVDGLREDRVSASERCRSPIHEADEGMSFVKSHKERLGQQQDVARMSSATRRATVGDGASMTPTFFESSRLPTVPPKSKQRPFSMDTKGRGGQPHTKMEYTTVKLNQPRQQQQQRQHQQPTVDSRTPTKPKVSLTQHESVQNAEGKSSVHQKTDSTSSTDTFGQGRRSSLNSTNNVTIIAGYNGNVGRAPPAPDALHGNDPISQDGSASSSYSSTTSSAFSATSTSTSSTSPPSTQTKKHSILTAKTESSLADNKSQHSESVSFAPSKQGSKLPKASNTPTVVSSATYPSLSSANGTTHFSKAEGEKEVRRFRDVDFDNRIQEDVCKLALSSSSSHNNLYGKVSSARTPDPKLDIQATDPKVLAAPIVVPENMSLARNQCIQSQVSQIVLPPLESSGGGQPAAYVERNVVGSATGVTDNTSTSFQRSPRRVSVGSSIPLPTSTMPASGIKIWPSSLADSALGGLRAIPRFYQQGSSRRSSLDISRLPSSVSNSIAPSSPSPATVAENKAKFSDRIKVFERL
ncbi:hypothetical protein BGZ68_010260 [Mortierella alpina]|nr:hypothetical protein BGZ68_010260 [Mortierella alpina]